MLVALSVQQGILRFRISGPHDVVQNHRCQDEMLCVLCRLIHGHQETPEAVGHDAECVSTRQMIVEDPPFISYVVSGEGPHYLLLQWESVVANHEVWDGCVITGKWYGRLKAKGPVLQVFLEL